MVYMSRFTDNIIKNNILSVRHWGIYGPNGSGVHKYLNNNITKTHSEWFIYATNMENVIIDSNEFIGLEPITIIEESILTIQQQK